MNLHLNRDRFLLGMYGLGLLRRWPFGDPDEAESQIAAIRAIVTNEEGSEFIDVNDPGLWEAYALWSETYDDIANALIEIEEPVARDLLARVPAGRAVDAACGTGRFAAILAELGHEVLGVDGSAAMLARAKSKGIAAEFVEGDLRHLPVPDGSIDLLTCGLALTHLTDLTQALGEFARVVREGGVVLLSDVNPIAVATGGQAAFRTADDARAVAHNEQHWTSSYVNAFIAAGFQIERCEEPLIDERFGRALDPTLRDAMLPTVLGLPFALIWVIRKT